MSNLKSWSSPESGSVLARGQRKVPHGALLAANTRAQAEMGPLYEPVHQDVRGQALRQLRMQKSWDAVSLATQACISLRQLYQLESGETSLFYSQSLRNQAGRRVAAILGARWDNLEQLDQPSVQDKHLKLVSTATKEAPTVTPPAEPSPLRDPAPAASNERELATEVPMGLAKPAMDTLVVPTPVMAKISRHAQEHPTSHNARQRLHPVWTVVGWLLAAAVGAGTGSALAMFWGVRL